MLQGLNILEARKRAKGGMKAAKEATKATRQRINRIEKGQSKATIAELEALCSAYGFNICLLNDAEVGILQGIAPFLAKNGQK